ncbi:hypothetical protein OOJ91_13670 [Micromonospora lupini]|uniref:hypothetical protein n=1 Tax=Micromonospora lupini TaxID=285679 RepID=UPI002252A0EE|nr:hypothetical protein [Micromonospora lupini]MCX5066895.1 hypothetical protein [Micromonospora lupini]
MGSVATSTLSNPLQPPGVSGIDRQDVGGVLWTVVLNNASDGVSYYRSTNGGTSWALAGSWTISTTVQEISGLHITSGGELWIAYRTSETNQDRLWVRRCIGNALTFSAGNPLQISEPANGGVAGSIHTGLDVTVVGNPANGTARVVVAAGTTFSGLLGVTLHGVDQAANGTLTRNNSIITGKRQWMYPGTAGRSTPQMDIEHWGTGKGADIPHLWCVFGRQELRVVKLPWNGSTFAGPSSTVLLKSGLAGVDAIPGRWDGKVFLMAIPNPDAGMTDRVLVAERDASNTRTTWRSTPVHPTGVVRNCTLSYNSTSRDFRIFAVGTSTNLLYYVDFVRASGTWTSWGTVTGTAILGSAGQNYGVRHESAGSARYDVVTAHSGSPNTIVSTHQVLSYAPNTPVWDLTAIGVDNGSAANVSAALNLDWLFSDPDPADSQIAWALSRQIGAGALAYFRASDSTWQAAEVKNTGGTTARSLASGWGLTSDAPHSYRVKYWDSGDLASVYSDAFVVIPSGKVNPTITAPTVAQVLTTDSVTISWTVAEQTAYRVRLQILSEVVHDSGWVAGTATSYTPDFALGDLFSYTAFVQTRNLKGLASDEIQRNFSVDFVEPAVATLTVTPLPNLGVNRVTITNPTPVGLQPAVASQDVYRRPILYPYLREEHFETADMSGWGTPNAGTAARSTTRAHSGSWSYQLTSTGADPLGSYVETIKMPCQPGVTYFLDLWATASVATRDLLAQFRWYNAGGTFLSARNGIAKPAPAATVWDYRWAAATAPANATQMTLCAVIDSVPASGDVMWVDEVRVRVSDPELGVRIATGLQPGAVVDDWRAVSGVAYEYRAQVRSVIGTTIGGVWTA